MIKISKIESGFRLNVPALAVWFEEIEVCDLGIKFYGQEQLIAFLSRSELESFGVKFDNVVFQTFALAIPERVK
ncbi:hypothetical protein VII00023_02899 [Vibrio ichthyoenteri ATCC 700023]|uniref:Uncharacterized protein n=1 Tax=Vibrio ichthyoenteri ATCC 700023 TaxID=870968 RepID=F9S0Y1_9VIBR|nr:hypothetical protein [Vibrio ichthyoenteri]EGU42964.1 hypothetical protein VII00023_02899 [Vibrio ichthyoenteri ATCC 700023]